MTAAALLVVLGAALVMQAGGLSMAMGAFLAGVLLSESTFRHQLEADVEPFRGILLGLFFIGVGMALDLRVVADNIGLIVASVIPLMLLKMLGIYAVARLGRASHAEALERAVLMAQGGEFAFVLYAAAVAVGLLDAEENGILTAIIIISMALTPLLVILHDRLAPAPPSRPTASTRPGPAGDVLIIGFGRFGQVVSQPLLARGFTISIIDTDVEMIRGRRRVRLQGLLRRRRPPGHPARRGRRRRQPGRGLRRQAGGGDRIVELVKAEFPLVPHPRPLLRPRARPRARPRRRRISGPRDLRMGDADGPQGADAARLRARGGRRDHRRGPPPRRRPFQIDLVEGASAAGRRPDAGNLPDCPA